MKYRPRLMFLLAVMSGLYLSLMYISPYNGKIALSEAILQLSGSRGRFELGLSYSELVSFVMCLFPEFLFELFAGIMLYQNFCTASIYIFSRYPHRVKWYVTEVGYLGGLVCLYDLLLLIVTLLTTAVRYELWIDRTGLLLLVYHFWIHSLWVYVMTLMVNLLATFWGSSTAYALVISFQLVCVVLLKLSVWFAGAVVANPIAHLVLGWHRNIGTYMDMDLSGSLVIFLLVGAICTSIGALVIKRHDLLVSDFEAEV